MVRYVAPWDDAGIIEEGGIDMAFSQAVLEHVVNLNNTYRALAKWLKPSGFMSHQIDLTSHEDGAWNLHWECSDFVWRLIGGRNPYTLNRQPHSVHIDLLRKSGFRIVCDIRVQDQQGVPRVKLHRRYRTLGEDDLTTNKCFIQAVKQ